MCPCSSPECPGPGRIKPGSSGTALPPQRLFLPAQPTWMLLLEPHASSTWHNPQRPRAAPCPRVRAAPVSSPLQDGLLHPREVSWHFPADSSYSGKEGDAPPQAHTCVSLWHLRADAHISHAHRGRCAWSLHPQTLADKGTPQGPSRQRQESRPVLYCGHCNWRINHQCLSPGASKG